MEGSDDWDAIDARYADLVKADSSIAVTVDQMARVLQRVLQKRDFESHAPIVVNALRGGESLGGLLRSYVRGRYHTNALLAPVYRLAAELAGVIMGDDKFTHDVIGDVRLQGTKARSMLSSVAEIAGDMALSAVVASYQRPAAGGGAGGVGGKEEEEEEEDGDTEEGEEGEVITRLPTTAQRLPVTAPAQAGRILADRDARVRGVIQLLRLAGEKERNRLVDVLLANEITVADAVNNRSTEEEGTVRNLLGRLIDAIGYPVDSAPIPGDHPLAHSFISSAREKGIRGIARSLIDTADQAVRDAIAAMPARAAEPADIGPEKKLRVFMAPELLERALSGFPSLLPPAPRRFRSLLPPAGAPFPSLVPGQ